MRSAGVAILIHGELEHQITNIQQINGRIMQVTLHSPKSRTPLTILCTYAPQSGKKKTEQKAHWEQVQNTINEIPNKHILICCADTNGQLGQHTNEENGSVKIVGPYAKAKQTEKGNGQSFLQTCQQRHMIPMNTWKLAPLTKEEKTTPETRKSTRIPRTSTTKQIDNMDKPKWTTTKAN